MRSRLERDLARGDLRALSNIAVGRSFDGPDLGQVERLCEREFLAMTRKGRSRMTLKGWIAILLRHTIARREHHAWKALKHCAFTVRASWTNARCVHVSLR